MLKKISISLLVIIILLTTGFFTYRHFNNKKVEGIQNANSKIIGTPKVSENKPSPINSPSQTSDQNNLVSENKNQNNTLNSAPISGTMETNNSTNDFSTPNYTTPNYPDTNNDFLIKQAEEEALQAAEERRKNDEACRPILAIREQLLAPLNAQFNEITRQMNAFEANTNARTDITEAQKNRILAIDLPVYYDQLNAVSQQITQVNANYSSCMLYNF